jgi:hypothetical protein
MSANALSLSPTNSATSTTPPPARPTIAEPIPSASALAPVASTKSTPSA